jgi:hypothetical protein
VEANVTLRRTSLLGKGKKLFSMLSKPAKPKSGFSGISSDDFSTTSPTSPPDLPPRTRQLEPSISIKTTEENKPLPAIRSPEELISPKETISSLLPPIIQKIESGDKNAIRNLVESSIDELDGRNKVVIVEQKSTELLPTIPSAEMEKAPEAAIHIEETMSAEVTETPEAIKVQPEIVKATVYVQEIDEQQSAVTHEISERIEVNEEDSSKTLGESVQYLNTKEIDDLISDLTSTSDKNESALRDSAEVSRSLAEIDESESKKHVEMQSLQEPDIDMDETAAVTAKEDILVEVPAPSPEERVEPTSRSEESDDERVVQSLQEPETRVDENEVGSGLEQMLNEVPDSSEVQEVKSETESPTQSIEVEAPSSNEREVSLAIDTTGGVTVIVDEETDDSDAQNMLQDLLLETDQINHVSTPRTPGTPMSPRTPRSQLALVAKMDVSIQTDADTVDGECQTQILGTVSEIAIQTDTELEPELQTVDIAVSPILIHATIDAEQQTEEILEDDDNSQFVHLLQEENMRLVQELETLKLMVTQAKSQAQQMKILKEAAEARFEQLARVAHRKLVRAMAESKKQ